MPSQLASAVQTNPPQTLLSSLGQYNPARLVKLLLSDTNWIQTLQTRDANLAYRDYQLSALLSTIAQRLATVWGSPQYQLAVEGYPIVGRNVYGQPYIPDSPAGLVTVQLPDTQLRPTTVVITGNGWRSRDNGSGIFPACGPFLGGSIFYQTGALTFTLASAQTGMLTAYVHDFWLSVSTDDLPAEGPMAPPFDPTYVSGLSYPIDAANTDYELAERDRAVYSVLSGWANFLQRFDPADSFQAPLIPDFPVAPLASALYVNDVWSNADAVSTLTYASSLAPWGTVDITLADQGLAWRDNALASWAASVVNLWNVSARWLTVANRLHARKLAPALVSGLGVTPDDAFAAPGGIIAVQSQALWDWELLAAMLVDYNGNFIFDSFGNAIFGHSLTSGVRWQDRRRPPEVLHLAQVTAFGQTWQTETPGDSGAGLQYDAVRHVLQPVSAYQDVKIAPEVAAMGIGGDTGENQTIQLLTDIAPAYDLTALFTQAAAVGNEGFLQLGLNGRLWAEPLTGTNQDRLGQPLGLAGVQFWGANPVIMEAGASLRLQNVLETIDIRPGVAYQFAICYKPAQTITRYGYQYDPTSQGATAQPDGSAILAAALVTNVPNSISNVPSLYWPLTIPAGQWSITLNTNALPSGTRWSCWLNGNLIGATAPVTGATSITFEFTWTGGAAPILTNLDAGPAGVQILSFALTQISCALGQTIPNTFELTLESASAGSVLAAVFGSLTIPLTDRRGNRLLVPTTSTTSSWLQAQWEAVPDTFGYLTTETGIPIVTETGTPLSITPAPSLIDITPEVVESQSLPNRPEVFLSGVYNGSDLGVQGAYSLRVDWSSAVVTPIEIIGWSVSQFFPGDPCFAQSQRTKSRYALAALDIISKSWAITVSSAVTTTTLTGKNSAFSQTDMYNWLNDLTVTLPNLTDAVRPSLPGDLGKPALVPQSLTWTSAAGANVTYSQACMTPKLVTLQPWHLELGVCVLKEAFWHVPTLSPRAPLID